MTVENVFALLWAWQECGIRYFFLLLKLAVFRIRIRSDPYHWPGSGSVSGNVDLDLGTKKKS